MTELNNQCKGEQLAEKRGNTKRYDLVKGK